MRLILALVLLYVMGAIVSTTVALYGSVAAIFLWR